MYLDATGYGVPCVFIPLGQFGIHCQVRRGSGNQPRPVQQCLPLTLREIPMHNWVICIIHWVDVLLWYVLN